MQVDKMVSSMEGTNILVSKEMTFDEYSKQLIEFQDMLIRMIMDDNYNGEKRLSEVAFFLETEGRKLGLSTDDSFLKGVSALKKVNKEISICLSGKNGENSVAQILKSLDRTNVMVYRNIHVVGKSGEAELDDVILTDLGIIVLEVKNIKDNVAITDEGRLIHNSAVCYGKKPLGKQMSEKRLLLKSVMEEKLASKGMDIPINVDSFIVFSAPKGVYVNVQDKYHKEKWCFKSNLLSKLKYYNGKLHYSKEQITQIKEVLEEMKLQTKKFTVSIDFDEIRRNIAEMLVIIREAKKKGEKERKEKEKNSRKKELMHLIMEGVVVGMISGIVTMGVIAFTSKIRRKIER